MWPNRYRAGTCEMTPPDVPSAALSLLGCKGRIAVHDLLVASDDSRRAIQSRAWGTGSAALPRQKVLGGLRDLTQVKAAADR